MFSQEHQRMEGVLCSGGVKYGSQTASPAQNEIIAEMVDVCSGRTP